MDQLKSVFRGFLKYRFWIISSAIAPLLLGGWFSTTARLRSETDDRVTKIEQTYNTAKDVLKKENHPNNTSDAGMVTFIETLKDDVYDAWLHQYRQQESILVWPAELKPDFIEQVEHLRPIEKVPYPTPQEQELRREFRERYRDYIQQELPKLAQIINAPWSPSQGGGGGMAAMDMGFGGFGGFGGAAAQSPIGGPAPGDPQHEFMVRWNSADQAALRSNRFDWSQLTDKAPRTLDILYAQEDLWVLRALMEIIAKTNEDATGNYNATIKEITSIQMGRSVGGSTGSISSGGGNSAAAWDAMWGAEEAEGAGRSAGDPSAAGFSQRRGDPAHQRYVDNDYNPVSASDLRTAINSGAKSPENAYLVVAKRIPIRINLVMDQRHLYRFITACGNSNLIVEIRQVRINRSSSSGASGMGGFGDDAASMMGVDVIENEDDDQTSGFEALGGGPESLSSNPGAALLGLKPVEEKPLYDLPIEFYGMVYIYNPVDTDKLGIENVEAEASPPSSEAATTPEGTATPEPAPAADEAPTPTPPDDAPAAEG